MRRFAPAAIAWVAAAALAVLWLATRGSLELNPIALGAGIVLSLRLDAIAFASALTVLLGGAALLTLRQGERWTALLAMAAATLAVVSGNLVLTAAAAGMALLFVLEASGEEQRRLWPLWIGVLMLAWAGVSLQVVGGTAGYAAAPVSALNAGIAGLILLAAAAFVGAFGLGNRWPPVAWIAIPPIGFCLLLRVFELGGGRLPQAGLYLGATLLGLGVWGFSAWRAASADSWREFAGESLPAAGGVGLVAAGTGVQLGGVALVLALFATAILAVLTAAGSTRRRADALIGAAVIGALPPGLGFAARLLATQALLESDQSTAVLLLPAAVAWLLWLLAALRAVSLAPAGAAVARWLVPALGAASMLGGICAGLLTAGVAQPAVAAAGLGGRGPRLSAGLVGIEPVSGGWPALVLGGVLVLGVAAAAAAAGTRLLAFSEPLAPLFPRWRPRIFDRALPDLPRLPALEPVLTGARPLFWVVLIAALALAVTRAPL